MRMLSLASLPLISLSAAVLLTAPSPAEATTGADQPASAAVAPAADAKPAPAAAPAGENPVPATVTNLPAAKPKPLPPTLVARINLTSQTMTVQAGGKAVHTWKISSGAPGYATPPGTFKPGWMAQMWYSRQYDDAPMPHSVFFNGGIAVHATTSIHNLGRAASHGCVRLAPANAARFYKLVSSHGMAHTRIVVHGNQPFSAGADRIARLNKPARGKLSPQRNNRRLADNQWYMAQSYSTFGYVGNRPSASRYDGSYGARRMSATPARRGAAATRSRY